MPQNFVREKKKKRCAPSLRVPSAGYRVRSGLFSNDPPPWAASPNHCLTNIDNPQRSSSWFLLWFLSEKSVVKSVCHICPEPQPHATPFALYVNYSLPAESEGGKGGTHRRIGTSRNRINRKSANDNNNKTTSHATWQHAMHGTHRFFFRTSIPTPTTLFYFTVL